MDEDSDEIATSPKAKRLRLRLMSTDSEKDCKTVEELILDYACKNYMDDVISALANHRGHSTFKELNVPHLRILLSTIHSVVQRENVAEFDNVLNNLDLAHKETTDLISDKEYVELTTGIKTKVLLKKLAQPKFDYAGVCAKLNEYFPKSQLKLKGISRDNSQLNAYQLRYRRLLTRLMLSASERETYLRNDRNTDLGPSLSANIQQWLRHYCDKINDCLRVPVIEQILSEGPQSQISHDLQESHSDCMDQLLATCFRGPPTSEQLLAILKTSWEQENDADISSQSEEDVNDYSSASDIFDIHSPPKSRKVKTSDTTRHPNHEEPSLMSQNANRQDASNNRLDPGPSRESTSSKLHRHGNQGGPGQSSSRQKSTDPPTANSNPQLETENFRVEMETTSVPACVQLKDSSTIDYLKNSTISPNPKWYLFFGDDSLKSKDFVTPRPATNKGRLKNGSSLGLRQQKISSSPTAVSKTRIYLSKQRPQIYWKPTKNPTKDILRINDTQDSSSVESRNSSELSSTSVSLLTGPFKCLRNWSASKTIADETEIMELSISDPFEDMYFSEIAVYPVERLQECYAEVLNRNGDITINETPMSSATEPQSPIKQDDTVSSSMLTSPTVEPCSSQEEVTEVEEVTGVQEVEGQEVESSSQSTVVVEEETKKAELSSAGGGVDNNEQEESETQLPLETSCQQDAENPPTLETTPVIRLKRLSQDSQVRTYLDNAQSDEEPISSDSNDSFVPESDDESGWTSESSGLPYIELKSESDSEVVRRFPSLNQFCQGEASITTTSHRVRRCTVQLQRLKPEEIDAYTKEK